MVKISQYQQGQVAPALAQDPTTTANVVDYTPIARGISAVGVGASNMMNRVDKTSAEESLLQFEKAKNDTFFNPDTGYLNYQGRDAYDNAPATRDQLTKLKEDFGKDLNENARTMYNRAADAHIVRADADIAKHAAEGMKAWEVSIIEAQVENSTENAALYWNQPDRMKVQRVIGEDAVIKAAKTQGISAEATNERLQTFRSVFASTAITAALSQGSAEAEETMDKYGSMLEGPASAKLKKAIDSKKKTEKTKATANTAVLTATRLTVDYDNRADIIDEVNKISDPELREATMSQAMSQFDNRIKAEKEEQGEIFSNVESLMVDGGTVEEFQAEQPEQWDKLTGTQKRTLKSISNSNSKKVIATNYVKFSELSLLPEKELAKINPADYFDVLAKPERQKLISMVKAARGEATQSQSVDVQVGRTRAAQTNMAVNRIFGDKKKWKDDTKKRIDLFYSTLDDEVNFREEQTGKKLSSEEYTDVLAGFTRNLVIEKPWYMRDADTGFDDIGISDDEVKELSQHLRDNNIPVTTPNLIKAYKQASEK